MAKYYKFHYDIGCDGIGDGTEIEEIVKYNDDVSNERVQSDFNLWCEKQKPCYDLEEISEEEANELGIDYEEF